MRSAKRVGGCPQGGWVGVLKEGDWMSARRVDG